MMIAKEIISNKIQCKECGEIIESVKTHDFKRCSCGSCAVDGGKEYLRREFRIKDCFVELSEVIWEDQ